MWDFCTFWLYVLPGRDKFYFSACPVGQDVPWYSWPNLIKIVPTSFDYLNIQIRLLDRNVLTCPIGHRHLICWLPPKKKNCPGQSGRGFVTTCPPPFHFLDVFNDVFYSCCEYQRYPTTYCLKKPFTFENIGKDGGSFSHHLLVILQVSLQFISKQAWLT